MGVDYDADLYGAKTLTSYMNLRVAPAASYEINDQLSVGVTANLMYAMMKYEAVACPSMTRPAPSASAPRSASPTSP